MINLIVCAAAGCAAIVRRHSKVIFWLLWIVMLLMMGGNTTSPDRDAYVEYFKTIDSFSLKSAVEPGFQVLVLMCKLVGISYEGFLLVYATICFLLLAHVIGRLSDNRAIVLVLYLLYPYILDADQIRSFLGQLIVLEAIAGLITDRDRSMLRYLLTVAAAMLFQQSCAVFLVYLFIGFDERRIRECTLIVAGILLFGRGLIPAIASRIPLFNLNRVANYFSAATGKANWIIYGAFYLFIIGMALYFLDKKKPYLNERQERFDIYAVRNINIISIALIPLLTMNPHFERLLRPVLLLDYMMLTNLIGERIRYRYEAIILTALTAICLARFGTYVIGDGRISYIEPLFFNGRIL